MDAIRLIDIKEGILSGNKALAEDVRARLRATGTFMLNLMSSPGSGKTSLILRTIEALREQFRIAVIEADIDSTVDSEKVAAHGIMAVQLRTGGFCHLDATMVSEGLGALQPDKFDLIIIENVGNLVCPAEFDTGATKDAMLLSIPEGDDKPLKYPLMFSKCDALVVTKIDARSYFDFKINAMKKRVRILNPRLRCFMTSAKTGEGIESWANWLGKEIRSYRQNSPPAQ